MINTKFIINNFKSYIDLYNKKVTIISKNPIRIITEPFKIEQYDYETSTTEESIINLHCCISNETNVNNFTKYISWEHSFCNTAYKYILSQSTKLKTKYNNRMIHKYIINRKWEKCHYIKNLTLYYKYIDDYAIKYTRIKKNIILNSSKSNIVFSSTIVSQLKTMIDDDDSTNKYESIHTFIRTVFNYKEDITLLNENTLKILLKKCSSKNKMSLAYILLDNKIELYIKQKMEFHSIKLEMNEDTKVCYIYTLWNEMENIIC